MQEIITFKNVSKQYGFFKKGTKALDNFSLDVQKGEVMGFLGPNGAGKSTAIRILLGMLKSDTGTTRLFGENPWEYASELHKRLSYIPGETHLWPELTGGETIDFLARIHKIDTNTSRFKELNVRYAALFDLDVTKNNKSYSKGNRQKVVLTAAFCQDAELLVLDEPTTGLDPLMEEKFGTCINEFKAQGKSVLLSSHILSEVEKLCDRVTIIKDGKRVMLASVDELKDKHESLETVFLKEYDAK
jgi:ABC-2 type transport system ATP-binding protein